MKRFIENYKETSFDVIIIGGGITGAAVAYDAASRGLKTALIEKNDFGWATSAATSKLIHGGLRYLNNMEFSLVRESLKERRILENIAPNLVYPIPFLFPHSKKFISSKLLIRTGLTLYDIIAYDKASTWDKSKAIKNHSWLSKSETEKLEPAIRKEGLTGSSVYYDCQSIAPERLTLAFIKSAVNCGASVSNYTEALDFIQSADGKITGIKCIDTLSPKAKAVAIKSKLVINCAGPWADIVLNLAYKKTKGTHQIKRSEGIHIITKKISNAGSVVLFTPKGRHFFTVPWRGHSITGTTDKEYEGNPDKYRVTAKSIQGLIDDMNSAYGDGKFSMKDVLFAYGGMRPLVDEQTEGTYQSSRKYEIYDNKDDGFDGLITVEGGKYTTSRNLALSVVDMAGKKLGVNLPETPTDKNYLYGSDIKSMEEFLESNRKSFGEFSADTVDYISKNYGTESAAIFNLAQKDKSLKEEMSHDGEIAAEVLYTVKNEMAKTLLDVIMRRTGIGTLGNPGKKILEKTALIAGKELGWSKKRIDIELAAAEQAVKVPLK
jgi:glycerol-3-phosphate dehydrogenase